MRLLALHVENFRGIGSLDWSLDERITCLIGPGDAGKTTVLDAIEWALSPRWALPVSDADFHRLDVEQPIVIEATVAEVPDALLTDRTYVQHARYICADEGLHDEPTHDGDVPVLTVRLTVDETLEPQWCVVCGDRLEPRPISNRHRAALGVTRLGGNPDRHLRWGRGSALERLTDSTGGAQQALATVYRSARKGVSAEDLESLDGAVDVARRAAPSFGAGIDGNELSAAIDPAAFTPGAAALALHDADIPLTSAGVGTRRLAALALGAASVPAGAIVLIDEIETGLEPHRLRHLLRLLRIRAHGEGDGPHPAQVIMTTHSPTTVVELNAPELRVTRRTSDGSLSLRQVPSALQGVVRGQPEAMLAAAIIVGEGATEHGLLRGIDAVWAAEDGGTPLAHRGVALTDGGGNTKAPGVAIRLAELGYRTALLVDDDEPIHPGPEDVKAGGVHLAQWADGVCTEERLTLDLELDALHSLLRFFMEERGHGQVRGELAALLGHKAADLPPDLADWPGVVDEHRFRAAAGTAMARGSWMKRIAIAQEVAELIGPSLAAIGETNFGRTLSQLRLWADGG